jgi:Calx-beta domain-containing protein
MSFSMWPERIGPERMRARVLAVVAVLAAAVASVVGTGVIATAATAGCAPPVVSVAGTQQYEGSGGGTKTITLTVTMAPPAAGCPVSGTVRYRTVDGTAVAGQDYTATSSTLSWTGPGPRVVPVQIARDDAHEPDERFTVELFGARGVTIAEATAVATVIDDDAGASHPDVVTSIPESGICWWPGDKCAIPVRLNTVARAPVTMSVHTVDGTAVAGKDYVPVKKETLTIPAGADHVDLPLDLLTGAQDGTSFGVEIGDVTAGTIGVGSAKVTIRRG